MLVYRTFRARAIDYDRAIRPVPRLQAKQRSVSSDLVLEHEMHDHVAIEDHWSSDERLQHGKRNRHTSLVVHGAASNDGISGNDRLERRMCPRIYLSLSNDIEVGVKQHRASRSTAGDTRDETAASLDAAEWWLCARQARQSIRIMYNAHGDKAKRRNTVRDQFDDAVLVLEDAALPNQGPQQVNPRRSALLDESRQRLRRIVVHTHRPSGARRHVCHSGGPS
jgi:hypothetical protein